MFKTIRQRQPPDIQIGPHRDDPYTCALHDLCWKFLPSHSVLDLYRGTKKSFALLCQVTTLLKNISADLKLTANQAIQKATADTGKPHVNQMAILKFLGRLEYPLHFLDFETIGTLSVSAR